MELIIRPTQDQLAETHPHHIYRMDRNEFHSFYISKESAELALTTYQSKKEISIADPR